jgi:hypothetical protein
MILCKRSSSLIKMPSVLCTSPFIRINPAGRFPYAICLQSLNKYSFLNELCATVPKFGDRLMVMIEQGIIAIRAFDALNKTSDSIAKL